MRRSQFTVLVFALSQVFSQPALARELPNDAPQKIDPLFAEWEKPDSPGGVVAVLKDGKVVYSHAYGLSNLDYGIRNTPETVFNIGSMSKQFTAFAIYLLAQDGKLSLDDDVRKYVPELHDFGNTITIRNLLNHTSGLRDEQELLNLSGRRWDDAFTEQDVLNLLWRQKELNFAPGTRYFYSNTGYVLLGLIVSRVSGMSLPEFTDQRIFGPLGMTHTHFEDDYGVPVKDRSYSYWRGGSPYSNAFAIKQDETQYKYLAHSNSVVGATGLLTTAGDLARWDENFYTGRVGGKAIIADMESKAHLKNGKEIEYGAGLELRQYRGLKTIGHSGADAGYTSNIMQFPDQHFSVIILSNTGTLDLYGISEKIADIYLGDEFKESPKAPHPNALPRQNVDVKRFDSYLGDYQTRPDYLLTFTNENGTIMVQGTGDNKVPTVPVSDDTLSWAGNSVTFTFGRSPDGKVNGKLHYASTDITAPRIQSTPPTPDDIRGYVGKYYSDELNVVYEVLEKNGALTVRYSLGDYPLGHVIEDTFIVDFPISKLQFVRDQDGKCIGFIINDDRALNVRFDKVSLP